MDNIVIRKGSPADADHFARLALYTAPEYLALALAPDPARTLGQLFRHPNNLFSHTYSRFMEIDGEPAGMSLFYDYEAKKRGMLPFITLTTRILGKDSFHAFSVLARFALVFGRIQEGDMYSSNSALYPKFRARGFGARLFTISEEEARRAGLKRVVVDVAADNTPAISLRQKLGYRIDERLPIVRIGTTSFTYLKLVKDLQGTG